MSFSANLPKIAKNANKSMITQWVFVVETNEAHDYDQNFILTSGSTWSEWHLGSLVWNFGPYHFKQTNKQTKKQKNKQTNKQTNKQQTLK